MIGRTAAPPAAPTASELTLCEDATDGVTVARRGYATTIAVAPEETQAVHRAVRGLVADLHTACDAQGKVVHSLGTAQIVVGTIGTSPLVDDAVASGNLDISELQAADGSLLWEAYVFKEIDGRLWIVGADRRATIFGLYTLSRAAGVSPWSWWADVPVRARDHVTIPVGLSVADHPSVRYRGIFLNDEEELEAWANANTSDGTLGPETYERIFELLLRLKANYIWPAMHVNAFNDDPENGRLANEMGIVVGTSHCDMLLRSNQHEWEPWRDSHGYQTAEYDYSIPGANRDILHKYWRESVAQNRDYEASWTLGMRGIHDSAFQTRLIDDDPTLTEEEKQRARVALLGSIIEDQRSILRAGLAPNSPPPLQTFVPYKEVLPLYDGGLHVPDDVTIIWSDDSYGHIRRFPDDAERARSGGHGLYYHSSYWSPPSRSYLWISSMPLAQMKYELGKAWDRGIRTLWVDNIGSLKPLEQDADFFLSYAWEAGKETTTTDPTDWLAAWIDQSFSGGHGRHVAGTLEEWAQVTHVRRVEQLSSSAFSQIAWGDESARRLARLRALYDTVNETYRQLPARERDAFFQLVVLKVHASYLSNAEFAYADRSVLAFEQGKMQAADEYLDWSRRFTALRRTLIGHYNTVMSDGKWDRIMTPDAFPPPAAAQYPAARPALTIGEPGLGVVVWGEKAPTPDPQLTFFPLGVASKWIEVFNTGCGSIDFELTADDWILLPERSGTVTAERRIPVGIAPGQPAGSSGTITIRDMARATSTVVIVRIADLPTGVPDGSRYVEADGYISVPAAATSAESQSEALTWARIRGLGRGSGDLVEARALPNPNAPAGAAATLEYGFHLATAGSHLLEIHRHPTLDATGRMRITIGVDDQLPAVVETDTTDEYRGTWQVMVVDQVERLHLRLPHLEAGNHLLRIGAVDEGFAFTRWVLHTQPPQESALGPVTSHRIGDDPAVASDPAPDLHDIEGAEQQGRELYRLDPALLPLPPVIYVPRGYWNKETTFTRNVIAPQKHLATPTRTFTPTQARDVISTISRGPVREHDGTLMLDMERTLLDSADGWRTPSRDTQVTWWTHTQAETNGGAGLALHVDEPGRIWPDPTTAPGMHLTIDVTTPGEYRTWALVKFDSNTDDSLYISLDGEPRPLGEQFSGGDMFSFGTSQAWVWVDLCDLTITAGRHVLSVLARKARLRVVRLYLTLGDELPPADAQWAST